MNILILGSGGREHTFAYKISESIRCNKLYVAPGNAGTSEIATNISIAVTDFKAIKESVIKYQITMVVVGPEDPLVKGIVDNPEDVIVKEKTHRRGTTLEVRVNPEDIGKVIGRNGRTAKALRTVVSAIAGRTVRVDLIDTDEAR